MFVDCSLWLLRIFITMINKTRYSVLYHFILFFLAVSFLIRTVLLFWAFKKVELSFIGFLDIYGKGLIFDLATAIFFMAVYSIYLLLVPERWNRSIFNKIITYTAFILVVFILMFSFFAEFTFWGEYESRFNFIAVNYLIYTYEVVNNINESYPLPLLIGGMLLLTLLTTWIFARRKIFYNSFTSTTPFRTRIKYTGAVLALGAIFYFFLNNSWGESRYNRYQNELSKAGIWSFFAAYKNNELDFYAFYRNVSESSAFDIVRNDLSEHDTKYKEDSLSIRRTIYDSTSVGRPNVILVTIESFSADFMKHFGNTKSLTPFLDSLADKSILFTNLYATGTRTVRGMEALTLGVPPTPGNSIVRRQDNDSLFSVGTIFRKAGYTTGFFYGGDGFFDNMNAFFGSNGFDITDHGGRLIGEHFKANRTVIPKEDIHFDNAWGMCDEDLYDAVIRDADLKYGKQQRFFDFVMTTSNHKPYTYPEGKIDIPSGSGRDGAVKYTDYAIGEFVKKIQLKPWFENTVIIFIADHCASSAGKNEIDIAKYHIPCIIYNLKTSPARTIDVQCSQIDMFPTLFGLLHWQYESNWYGKNALLPGFQGRICLGTYQELGFLQHDSLVVLSPQRKTSLNKWDPIKDEQKPIAQDSTLLHRAIAWYQTAYYLYKNGKMKE